MSGAESQQDRTVRLALAAGRANLVVDAARQLAATDPRHRDGACGPCVLCAAVARHDASAEQVAR